jgi:hypothetical protein
LLHEKVEARKNVPININFLNIVNPRIYITIYNMNYLITKNQLSCINILIRTLQEAINRKCFNEDEAAKIYETVEKLNTYINN